MPQFLDIDDSHNVISMGVSPADGRLHLVLGTHASSLRYIRSIPGLLTRPATVPWSASSFLPESLGLPGAAGAPTTGTYPVFETTSAGQLYFTWREGASDNGRNQLARYDAVAGSWTFVGAFTSSTGSYSSQWGTSTNRYAYLHGFEENPRTKELTATWSWRENKAAWCDPNGLGNHDLGYATSSDGGKTWKNSAGATIGVAGTADLISVTDPHVVVPIGINRGLINQESMTFDAQGRPHVLTSSFSDADLAAIGGCHRQTYTQRAQYAKPFHHWREADGTWRSLELPFYNNSAGRSRLLFDANDTAYVVLPDARIVASTAASGWTDWRTVFDDPAVDNIAELIVDRTRLSTESVLSVAYQERPVANAPSAFRVADFSIVAGAASQPRSTTPQAAPTPYVPVTRTAAASSAQPGYAASNAVDGSTSSFWVSGGTTDGAGPQPSRPEVLTVTYGRAQSFDTVTVAPRNATSGIRAFGIEARVNGNWVRLADVTQGRVSASHTVPLTTADAIRLVITAAWDNDRTPEMARNVQVSEVSVIRQQF